MSDAIKNALRLAKQGRFPLHQAVARSGYATDGSVEGDVQTAPDYTPAPVEPVQQPDDRAHENVQSMLNENYRPSPVVEQMSGPTSEKALAENEIKPKETAHEFVQQALNKQEPQLPQMDREAYERMKYGAPEVLHAAAYTNPVTAPAAAAYDVYQGAKSGNPWELGMAATGLPGRTAKALTMGAAAMMPQDAEASPYRFLTNRGALDIARRAVEGAREINPNRRLMVTHSIDAANIDRAANRWGAAPSPSLAVSLSHAAPVTFGDSTLVGRPHLAVPSAENPIFSADAFTPRIPTISTPSWAHKEAGDTASILISKYGDRAGNVAENMLKRGEIDEAGLAEIQRLIKNPHEIGLKEFIYDPRTKQRQAPTLENVVSQMHSGELVGGEGGVLSPATGLPVQKALAHKPFQSIEEMMANRGNLASDEEEGGQDWANVRGQMGHMGKWLRPYHVNPEAKEWNNDQDFARAMVDYFKHGPEGLAQHYKDLPPNALQGIEHYAGMVRDLKPTYWEAKPKRGVSFDEFAGAVLPSTATGEMMADKLVELGVPKEGIHFSPRRGAGEEEARQKLLHNLFQEHTFAEGGEVEMSKNDRLNKIRQRGLNLTRKRYALDGAVDGAPDDASQEAFLKEQLAGSAPQYESEAGALTAKQAGLMGAGLLPGSGIASAAGKFPTAEGGYEPSMREDWKAGNYGSALMKGAGALGDVAQAVPVVGTAAGAALKAPLAYKLAMAAAPAAKIAKSAETADAVRLAKKLAEDKAKNLMQLPDLRNLPAKEGSKIAQKDLHLIPSGERSEGYYIGSPRNVQSPEDLTKIRKEFDKFVAQDPRGGDWYDRYRAGLTDVTGGTQHSYAWSPKMQAQWSAGVSPEGELGFTLREMNAALAGNPVKSARPAQHKAFMRALEENDPNKLQLGNKTGLYATKINPEQGHATATSVNDFRHARNFQYTEPTGEPQRNALTGGQHKFLDYETASAVGRANRRNLAGRSDWTGEQLQAAPWVRQKAQSLVEQRPALTSKYTKPLVAKYMADGMSKGAAEKLAAKEAAPLAYEDAFKLANTTIADFFPKHTFNATYEQIPGVVTNHLPGAAGASQELREAYSADPRSSWALAPGNRSGIYGGLFNYTKEGERTGPGMYVQPTTEMQGMFTPQGSTTPEFNPGNVDRPLVAFKSGKVKSLPAEDRALLEAGESARAYIDAQEGGAGHINWAGGAPGQSNSFKVDLDRKATPEEIVRMKKAVEPFGYSDVVDTGNGLTVTNFMNEPGKMSSKQKKAVIDAIHGARPEGSTGVTPVKTDSVYQDYSSEWAQGVGSGAATRKLLADLNTNPTIRQAFDKNEYIPQKALANMERDTEWQDKFGATREDIQNARKIIGEGPGWIGRLEEALKKGVILPAVAGAIFAPQMLWKNDQPSSSDQSDQT